MATGTAADLRSVVDRYIVCQSRRDPAALAEFHSVDGVVESPMYGTLTGRKAIEGGYRAFFSSFPDFQVEIERIVIEPPHIAVFMTITATHANEFFGLPGTNRRIDFRMARMIEMDGDQISHERRVYDFTGILVQVGVLRAKPAKP